MKEAMKEYGRILRNGIIDENPTFVQVIGMCPTLAVTTSATNGIGMGAATLTVLVCANVFISLVRRFVPDVVRIPVYVILIAGFATVVEFLLKAYFPELNKALGIYIPLIVVNCLILARAESFAGKNKALPSFFDGIGMGLGFTAALGLIGAIRELLGAGSIFGVTILPEMFPRTLLMILPPGAFITLGCLMALLNVLKDRRKKREEQV